MDAEKMSSMQAAFGSFLDPAFVSPAGLLGSLVGRVTVLWANLVIHVFSKQQVPVFLQHVHSMLAPGGVFIGVRPSFSFSSFLREEATTLLASRASMHAAVRVLQMSTSDLLWLRMRSIPWGQTLLQSGGTHLTAARRVTSTRRRHWRPPSGTQASHASASSPCGPPSCTLATPGLRRTTRAGPSAS